MIRPQYISFYLVYSFKLNLLILCLIRSCGYRLTDMALWTIAVCYLSGPKPNRFAAHYLILIKYSPRGKKHSPDQMNHMTFLRTNRTRIVVQKSSTAVLYLCLKAVDTIS